MRDEIPPEDTLAGLKTPADVGNGMTLTVTTWVLPTGDVTGAWWGDLPTAVMEFGEGTDMVTAPAAEVQATLATSGITLGPGVTPTAAGQAPAIESSPGNIEMASQRGGRAPNLIGDQAVNDIEARLQATGSETEQQYPIESVGRRVDIYAEGGNSKG